MLEVLIFWIMLYLITYGAGDLLFWFFEKLTGMRHKARQGSVKSITGFFVLTVAAEYISLFCPVNTRALFGSASVICLLEIYKIKKYGLSKKTGKVSIAEAAVKFLWLAFILVSVVNPAFNELHGDSDLYMVQSVKWARQYGVVRGVANFNTRIGFDSSLVCFYALASLKAMSGGTLHAACGFLYVIFGFYGIEAAFEMLKKGFCVSRAFRVVITGYASSTVYLAGAFLSDAASNFAAGFILAEWMRQAEDNEEREEAYGLLCVLAVICASMKLSLALIALAALLPGIRLLKKKKYKSVAALLAAGSICIVPYVIRTVLLTGYLLFPMEKIDLFDVAWKVPEESVCLEREMVELWAKAPGTETDVIRGGIGSWLPIWLENNRGSYGYMLLLANVAALAVLALLWLFKGKRREQGTATAYVTALICALCANMLYWFFEAPDYRFIELLMYFIPVYLAERIYRLVPKHFPLPETLLYAAFIAVFFSYHPKQTIREDLAFLNDSVRSGELAAIALNQPPLKAYKLKTVDWYGMSINVPKGVPFSGDAPLPCCRNAKDLDTLYPLGEGIGAGIGVKKE
ncbi:MAG: hypothetical protein K5686_08735 [Lachnospiraceae bacterium]|nr:hypothetical protein [Lachnospiraceae bacterium]